MIKSKLLKFVKKVILIFYISQVILFIEEKLYLFSTSVYKYFYIKLLH